MKRELSLKVAQEMYGEEAVRQTEAGFEVYDKKSGIAFVIRKETDVMFDGSLFDQIRLLHVPLSLSGIVVPEGMVFPVSMKYLCGNCQVEEDSNGGVMVKFTPGIFADKEDRSADAILLVAHWDVREGVGSAYWNDTVRTTFEVLHSAVIEADDYHMAGDYYWVLRCGLSACGGCDLVSLAAHYYSALKAVLETAEEAAVRFEQNRDMYRQKIIETVSPFVNCDNAALSVSSTEDETVVGGVSYRHDAVGLGNCVERFRCLYIEMFKRVVPEILKHTMEVRWTDDREGIEIYKMQPPTKFPVGTFGFNAEGWEKLHKELDFLK